MSLEILQNIQIQLTRISTETKNLNEEIKNKLARILLVLYSKEDI